MQSVIEAENKKRTTEVAEREDRMQSQIVSLMEDHDKAIRGAQDYYRNIQERLLRDQTVVKVRDVTQRTK